MVVTHARRVTAAVVVGLMAVAAGACGEDTSTTDGPSADGLQPSGTPMFAGLVVPEGTRLVGEVFGTPSTEAVAILAVDGNPFTAFDDLAEQARDIGIPHPSSGTCRWHVEDPALVEVADPVPANEPRPASSTTLSCEGFATGASDGEGSRRMSTKLWWWPAGAEMVVEYWLDPRSDEGQEFTGLDPGPVPAEQADQLPDLIDDGPPQVGDEVGISANCFEDDYQRLRVPAGARVVGGDATPFGNVVLAVENPEMVLRDIIDQLESDDPADDSGHYSLESTEVEGGAVWVLEGGVMGGGGACRMISNPAGTLILVTWHND